MAPEGPVVGAEDPGEYMPPKGGHLSLFPQCYPLSATRVASNHEGQRNLPGNAARLAGGLPRPESGVPRPIHGDCGPPDSPESP
jgi:hypothetical protein